MKKAHWVPLVPFRALLREYLENEGEDSEIGNLVELLGVSGRRQLYRLLSEEGKQFIEFDLADRIVTRLRGPMEWITDPELAELYESANLRAVDWQYPTSPVVERRIRAQARRAFKREGTTAAVARALGVSLSMVEKYLPSAPRDPEKVARQLEQARRWKARERSLVEAFDESWRAA